jgi:hypothetical protein
MYAVFWALSITAGKTFFFKKKQTEKLGPTVNLFMYQPKFIFVCYSGCRDWFIPSKKSC